MGISRGAEKQRRGRARNAAGWLADWLNSRSAEGHPVARLIERTQAHIRYVENRRANDRPIDSESFESYEGDTASVARRFPGFLVPTGMDIHPTNSECVWFRVDSLRRTKRANDGLTALNCIRVLCEAGVLWKIRRCALLTCRRVFVARFPHQAFHNPNCKERNKRSSSAYKNRRNEQARKAYYDGLTAAEKMTLDAKRARRKRAEVSSEKRKLEKMLM